MNSIDVLRDIPSRDGDRCCWVEADSGRETTFAEVHESARRVAAGLRRHGLTRGDRLVLLLNNSATFARLYLGCLYAGVVTVPVNPVLAAPEIDYIVRHSGARRLVASPETVRSLPDAGRVPVVLVDDGRTRGPALAAGEIWDPETEPLDDVAVLDGASPEDTLTVVYTSGTTGRPSGVVHRVADLVDNGRLFGEAVGIEPEHRFYGVLAMAYLGGYYNLLLLPYVNRSSVVLSNAFDARSALDFWSAAAAHGVNALWLVPTMMSILLELDRSDAGAELCRSQIDLALVGTAPLPASLRRDFEARYGLSLLENYALSETLFLTTEAPDAGTPEGSVGRTLPGVELQVEGSGEGELLARTPYLMEGYFDTELGGPRRLEPASWFPTGDLGRVDDGGNVFITGRRKDVIIRGGVNVSPGVAEDVLVAHPAVAECAVVGVPHPHYGEDSVAVVRLVAGSDVEQTRGELTAACREQLGSVSRPARIVVLDELPHSSSGKIQKARLREMLAGEAEVARA